MFRVVTLTILVLLTIASFSHVQAQDLTPVGTWQTASGESQYEISYCGGGTKLCAKLTWLRADAKTGKNARYLNKYVVSGARQTASNKWNGTINYAGERVGGSMTLVNGKKMRLQGCKLVFCQSVDFHRL